MEERRQRLQDYLRVVVRLCTEPRSVQGKRRRHQLDPIMKPDIDRETLQDILPFFRHTHTHTQLMCTTECCCEIFSCFHELILSYFHSTHAERTCTAQLPHRNCPIVDFDLLNSDLSIPSVLLFFHVYSTSCSFVVCVSVHAIMC